MSAFEGYQTDVPGQRSFPSLSIGLKQLFSAINKKKLVNVPNKENEKDFLLY